MSRTKIAALVLVVLISLVSGLVFTQSEDADAWVTTGQCGDNARWEYEIESKTLVIKGTGDMADYTECPWDDKTTWSDGYGGKFRMTINTIQFKGAIKSIGNHAFEGLRVKTVIMTDSIVDIGESAFQGCKYLATVNLSESITSIGKNAFKGCEQLIELELPNSLSTISDNAFAESSLKNITIPASVLKISDNTFDECNSLTSVTIISHLSKIPHFTGCTNLINIVLPDTLSEIDAYTLKDCSNVILDFSGCTDLKKLYIHNWARYQSFSVPDTVESVIIDSNTVQTIHIGESVNHIETKNDIIKNYDVSESNTSFSSINGILFSKDGEKMWYPSGRENTSLTTPVGVKWVYVHNNFLESLTISEGTSESSILCKSLKVLNIPESLKSGASYPNEIAIVPMDYRSTSILPDGILIKFYSKYIDQVIASKNLGGGYDIEVCLNTDIEFNSVNLGTEYNLGDVVSSDSLSFSIPSDYSDYIKLYLSLDTGEAETPPSEYEPPTDWFGTLLQGIGITAGIIIAIMAFLVPAGGVTYYILVVKDD